MTRTIRSAACFLTSIAVLTIAALPGAHAQPRDEGLVAYWSFDEGEGGTAYDSSEHGHHGTIYGAGWATGVSGAALIFDGVDDYALAPYQSGLNPSVVPENTVHSARDRICRASRACFRRDSGVFPAQ